MRFGFDETRWLIEPRARSGGGYSTACWLIVKDKLTGRYLTYPEKRSYIKFGNSDEVAEYLDGLKEIKEDTK